MRGVRLENVDCHCSSCGDAESSLVTKALMDVPSFCLPLAGSSEPAGWILSIPMAACRRSISGIAHISIYTDTVSVSDSLHSGHSRNLSRQG